MRRREGVEDVTVRDRVRAALIHGGAMSEITPQELNARLGGNNRPLLLDVQDHV